MLQPRFKRVENPTQRTPWRQYLVTETTRATITSNTCHVSPLHKKLHWQQQQQQQRGTAH